MLKSPFVFLACLILLLSCNKQTQSISTGYVVTVNFDKNIDSWLFLHRLDSARIKTIDSCLIEHQQVVFKGIVTYPQRYLLSLKSLNDTKILIIENDSIDVLVPGKNLNSAIVSGSIINETLTSHQQKITRIYKKVDAFYPDVQRARLANDAEKLAEISNKIQTIEKEALNLNFEYIRNNPNSYLSAMILNDLTKRDSVDIDRISKGYKALNIEVKNCGDGKNVNNYLKLTLNN